MSWGKKDSDIDFYQSLKTLIAVDAITSSETVVVFYSACPCGLGSMGEDMLKAFSGATTPSGIETNLRNDYEIPMDHAFLLSKILGKGVKLLDKKGTILCICQA